jgi:hypothetical protein
MIEGSPLHYSKFRVRHSIFIWIAWLTEEEWLNSYSDSMSAVFQKHLQQCGAGNNHHHKQKTND